LQERWGVLTMAESVLEYGVYVLVWLLFAFLYVFMPNTRVSSFAALVGGIVAGSTWQFTQWAYLRFQANVGEYNAIYGALAQLPVLMAWFYLSWLVVLLGAEITYGVENVGSYAIDRLVRASSGRRLDDYLALAICIELARAEGAGADADCIAGRIGVPARTMGAVLERLERRGIVRADRRSRQWMLARPSAELPVAGLVAVVEGTLPERIRHVDVELGRRVRGLLHGAAEARDGILSRVTVADLADEEEQGRASGVGG